LPSIALNLGFAARWAIPPPGRYLVYGPATDRLETHDKDVWSKFEK
jgi:hypothetical protein